jgi:uncharacterized protein (TIGR04222 family)
MNPFNLPDIEFLLFYLCLCFIVIIAMVLFRFRAESGAPPKMDWSDPYLIAYLRGGENESLRVATISLIDHGILTPDGQTVRRAGNIPKNPDLHPFESEVLKKFAIPRIVEDIFKYQDPGLQSALNSYKEKLQLAGLIPNKDVHQARIRRLIKTCVIIGIAAMIKLMTGLYPKEPISLFLVPMVAAMVIAGYLSFPHMTARGKAALAEIKNLYSGMRTRVNSFSPGSPGNPGASTAELAMFAAVFGAAALAATPFAFAADLLSKASGSSSSDSSSSSSSDSSSDSSDESNRWLDSWYEERNNRVTYSDVYSDSSDEGSSCGDSSNE